MTSRNYRFWAGLAVLFVLALVTAAWQWTGRVVGAAAGAQASAADAPLTPDTIKWVWTTPTPVVGYRAAAISPDGKYVGLVFNHVPGTSQEKLSLWRWPDRPDKPLWTRPEPDASLVVVGRGGETVLACARMDPLRPFLSVRKGADGAQVKEKPLDGAIWDVQMSADGQSAAVTTGSRGLYLFPSVERSGSTRFPTLTGIGSSIALTANGTYLAVGTWDDSGVSCDTLKKTQVWQYPKPDDAPKRQALTSRIFETEITNNGQFVLGLSYANARKSDGTLYLWRCDGDGTPLWVHPLGADTFFPKALMSEDGKFVAVTYLQLVTRGDQSISERRLLVLNGAGKKIWERGNLLFSPELVALAPDGHRVTVSDGQKTLYNLDAGGRFTAIKPLKGSATIRETMSTPDGRSVLVYTSDGFLNLFQIG